MDSTQQIEDVQQVCWQNKYWQKIYYIKWNYTDVYDSQYEYTLLTLCESNNKGGSGAITFIINTNNF